MRLRRVLGVSPSGYYAWRRRTPPQRAQADLALSARIRAIHRASRRRYGAPRIHAEPQAAGVGCGRKRVARLLRTAGLAGAHRRGWTTTTQREPTATPAPDHLRRQFVATAPDTIWTADITYIPTWAGFLYLAVVLDVSGRRSVGWAMADHLCTEMVLRALEMARWNRRPAAGVIHHSDHGFIDAYCRLRTGPAVFEVKSITPENELEQCRQGLSQLYGYRYPHAVPQASLWLVLSRQPYTDWYMEYLTRNRKINVFWVEDGTLHGPALSILTESGSAVYEEPPRTLRKPTAHDT